MLKNLYTLGKLTRSMVYLAKMTPVNLNSHFGVVCQRCGLNGLQFVQGNREIHASQSFSKVDDRRSIKVPKPDDGTEGEATIALEYNLSADVFPDENTPNMLVDGTKYSDLPICNVRVSKNNTIFSLTNPQGVVKILRSCGMEGFKNTKKGTSVAAQATGIAMATRIAHRGIKHIRVVVQGLGPGRMSSVKGLELGGLNIISLTDRTRVTWNCYRPRKQRRL